MNDLINNGIRYLSDMVRKYRRLNQMKARQAFAVSATTAVELEHSPNADRAVLSLLAKVNYMGQIHDCLFETVGFKQIQEGHHLLVISTDRYVLVLKQVTGKAVDRHVMGLIMRSAREQIQTRLHTKRYSLLASGTVVSTDPTENHEKIAFGGDSPMSLSIRRLSPYN